MPKGSLNALINLSFVSFTMFITLSFFAKAAEENIHILDTYMFGTSKNSFSPTSKVI